MIGALWQILDGVRDVQVVEGLDYDDEVDVRLLLEQLGGCNLQMSVKECMISVRPGTA